MSCLFCKTSKIFNTKEHIIPQSLGNDDLVIKGEVCDTCQNYFGKEIENYVLSKTPFAFWRTLLGIRTKKGNLPVVDMSQAKVNKGKFPDLHPAHNNVALRCHGDFTVELLPDKPIADFLTADDVGEIKLTLTPKSLFFIGRFLGKIAIELLVTIDRDLARSKNYDLLRKYSRFGTLGEIWPVFHANIGNINELITIQKAKNNFSEEVFCYNYEIKKVADYTLNLFRVF